MRLSVTSTLHRDDAGAGQQDRALGARARQRDGDVRFLRLRRVNWLVEELRSPRPRDRCAVGGPPQVVAALGRHSLHRHDDVIAAAGDSDIDGFAAGHRNGDDEMFALQADEGARAIGRDANLVGRRWIVAGTGARDPEVRPAVEAVHGDRLKAAVAAHIDAAVVAADEVRRAAALRGRDERGGTAGGWQPSQLERVGRVHAADLGRRIGIVIRRRIVEQNRIELIGGRAADENDTRSVRRERRVEIVAFGRCEVLRGAAGSGDPFDVTARGGPGDVHNG
jgi:hypothetical protein